MKGVILLVCCLSLGINQAFSQATNCDSLVIDCCNFQLLSNDTISLTAQNNATMEIFDYPGFILLDNNGDTLAIETVNYFGIGSGNQIHYLNVVNPISFPINANLQLWGGFYDTLYCEFPVSLAGLNSLEMAYSVYPNPVQDILYIDGIAEEEFSILTSDGKLVKTIKAKQEINVQDMKIGTYFLKPTTGTIMPIKFIKQ